MTASFAPALAAAHAAAGDQHYPHACLYVVATPIGNLADITLRALHLLSIVDVVACEDTRHTQGLLRAYGIDKPLLAVHEHNEAQAAEQICALLAQGQRIAYVSDAGTPAISDPGARLVRAAQSAGYRVVPLPGVSSVTSALSVAGLAGPGGFVFAGFLPNKANERQTALLPLLKTPHAVVLLESPHRIEAMAAALAQHAADRHITVARELTKQFEEVATMSVAQFAPWLSANAQRRRGEFVLVLHPPTCAPTTDNSHEVLAMLLEELPIKAAVRLAMHLGGGTRNELYAAALQIKSHSDGETAAHEDSD